MSGSSEFYFFKGRVALYAVLKAMGIREGDEVILPGFTCVVVPSAVIYLGAKPVYVDIDPGTYNIDTSRIAEKITSRTKAVIAQHTFGIPADMNRIQEIAARHNLYIIEDSCHAIGSEYEGRAVGTLGDAAFFSSQWSKPVTTGLGGWAVVNNSRVRDAMRDICTEFAEPSFAGSLMLRLQYVIHSALLRPSLFWTIQNAYRRLTRLGLVIGSSSNEELECVMPADYKKAMSAWQREVLMKKLRDITNVNGHRKWVVSQYENMLPHAGIETVKITDRISPVYLRYPILTHDKQGLLEKARQRRVELGDWFLSPVHPNLTGWEKAGYRKGMCPVAEDICSHIVNLPTHRGIGQREIDGIMQLLK